MLHMINLLMLTVWWQHCLTVCILHLFLIFKMRFYVFFQLSCQTTLKDVSKSSVVSPAGWVNNFVLVLHPVFIIYSLLSVLIATDNHVFMALNSLQCADVQLRSCLCIHVELIEWSRKRPEWARERCRISPPRFLAECCKRQLNQGSFVLLYFRLSTFFWFVLSLFICIFLYYYVCQYQSSDWLWRPPPKWPILCQVGR